MSKLQHNKTILVNGRKVKAVLCGSTNFAWRGLFVQNNHAVVLRGAKQIQPFIDAFEQYWNAKSAGDFRNSSSTEWIALPLKGVKKAEVTFSPHSEERSVLQRLADDVDAAKSSVMYSLAFFGSSKGGLKDALVKASKDPDLFVYGIADKTGGLDLETPDGGVRLIKPQQLVPDDTPEPFKSEPTGGGGTRMHHKFIVIDFDQPTARVYFGSNNMSKSADKSNGENLLLVQDRRVATAFMIEAVRIFDHYQFRLAALKAEKSRRKIKKVVLDKPPDRKKKEKAWWDKFYEVPHRIRDREMFS